MRGRCIDFKWRAFRHFWPLENRASHYAKPRLNARQNTHSPSLNRSEQLDPCNGHLRPIDAFCQAHPYVRIDGSAKPNVLKQHHEPSCHLPASNFTQPTTPCSRVEVCPCDRWSREARSTIAPFKPCFSVQRCPGASSERPHAQRTATRRSASSTAWPRCVCPGVGLSGVFPWMRRTSSASGGCSWRSNGRVDLHARVSARERVYVCPRHVQRSCTIGCRLVPRAPPLEATRARSLAATPAVSPLMETRVGRNAEIVEEASRLLASGR